MNENGNRTFSQCLFLFFSMTVFCFVLFPNHHSLCRTDLCVTYVLCLKREKLSIQL